MAKDPRGPCGPTQTQKPTKAPRLYAIRAAVERAKKRRSGKERFFTDRFNRPQS